ncbi:MAG: hypothetical protein H6945_14420 [Zoogloeaceae bacterium]|nr:hypothetical protein [Rhodocyclaceae bacterium]MCP5236926.1 hypothetical protein [Zoogloeaceae bacterium]
MSIRCGHTAHLARGWRALACAAGALAAAWLSSADAADNPLAHSRWRSVDSLRCPDAIYFGVRRYLFLNRCHAPAADGVIERGIYRLDSGRIELREREPLTTHGINGIGPSLRVLEVEHLGAERLVLRADRRSIEFRRSPPARLLPAAVGHLIAD